MEVGMKLNCEVSLIYSVTGQDTTLTQTKQHRNVLKIKMDEKGN